MALLRTSALLLLATLTGWATPALSASDPSGPDIQQKTVRASTYFLGEFEVAKSAFQERIKPLAEDVALAAVRRARLEITGPLTLLLPDFRDYEGTAELPVAFAYPVRGQGRRVPRYQTERKGPFKCLTAVFDESTQTAKTLWQALYKEAKQRGLEPSHDNRVVIRKQGDGYQSEYQLGLL
ncbi:hypothetical protein CF392_07215 [Tamilnaduibacter salinus]|uniref:Uncharacterized protein n=1 Tax=Tamilnaduibacter salinus TaxID=1484056 RepID=A0A2A2I4W2_9GAMM|nr:hypothetical protein [Tamilnaduibacter salinus]PAV26160.1 hypothetical protein CF392_07215 [Tamilnaduibacter salinus]